MVSMEAAARTRDDARRELLRRIAVTLGVIVVYRALQTVPLVGISMETVGSLVHSDSWPIVEQLSPVSIMSLGMRPYLLALMIGLMSTRVFKSFGRSISRAGGAPALDRWVRKASIPIALILAW